MMSFTKLEILSQISRDIGQVFFASMFIGPLASGAADWTLIAFGLLFSFIAWSFSLSLIK